MSNDHPLLPASLAYELLDGSVTLLAEKERLEADNGRLAERDQQRADLLARVSHDLRAPLTGILGFTELLLIDAGEGPAGRRRQECLEAIRRNGLSLFSLINDLLDVASLERGQFSIRREVVALEALLADVRAATESQLAASGCVVSWPPSEALTGLSAELDRRRLCQAIVNLIDNARRICGHGGRIDLDIVQNREGTVISVADNGPGIAPADRERIFQPFVRVEVPGQSASGVGLGLAIVQAVIDLHGGRIELDSSPGHGARFSLIIPHQPTQLPPPESRPGT